MSNKPITEEQLNAFVDGELDNTDEARILLALKKDSTLAAEICEIQQQTDLIFLAYHNINIPDERSNKSPTKKYSAFNTWQSLAASVVLTLSITASLFVGFTKNDSIEDNFLKTSEMNVQDVNSKKILIHINSMNADHIKQALDKSEQLLVKKKNSQGFKLEIVANAAGLGLLRKDSPYSDRVKFISEHNENVEFLACGIAMENARLKEGKEVQLLPEAEKIPAALDQILKRIKGGWTYVKS